MGAPLLLPVFSLQSVLLQSSGFCAACGFEMGVGSTVPRETLSFSGPAVETVADVVADVWRACSADGASELLSRGESCSARADFAGDRSFCS